MARRGAHPGGAPGPPAPAAPGRRRRRAPDGGDAEQDRAGPGQPLARHPAATWPGAWGCPWRACSSSQDGGRRRGAGDRRHGGAAPPWGDAGRRSGSATRRTPSAGRGRWPGGAHGRAGTARLRAAALGLAAEAMLERGSAEGAATRRLASGAPRSPTPGTGAGAAGDRRPGLLEGHLAWVLGLLERRRGRPAGAERAWSRALELLDAAGGAGRRRAPGRRVGRRGGRGRGGAPDGAPAAGPPPAGAGRAARRRRGARRRRAT